MHGHHGSSTFQTNRLAYCHHPNQQLLNIVGNAKYGGAVARSPPTETRHHRPCQRSPSPGISTYFSRPYSPSFRRVHRLRPAWSTRLSRRPFSTRRRRRQRGSARAHILNLFESRPPIPSVLCKRTGAQVVMIVMLLWESHVGGLRRLPKRPRGYGERIQLVWSVSERRQGMICTVEVGVAVRLGVLYGREL